MHGVGGIVGALLTGIFARERTFPGMDKPFGANGALYGNPKLLAVQLLTTVVAAVFSGVLTWVILKLVDRSIGLRVTKSDEREGLDTTQHGETGYAG